MMWENLCHRYSPCMKSFETGIVPVARYSHPLSSVLFKSRPNFSCLFNENSNFIINTCYWFMVFNTTFNNISVIMWQSVLLGGGNWSAQRKPPTCTKSLNCVQIKYDK